VDLPVRTSIPTKDGCTRIKKNISKEELTSLCNSTLPLSLEYTIEHRVMLNCETFEIYCTECQREILDFSLYNFAMN
jgi:hypothetical protein